jgi:hypothetical protein
MLKINPELPPIDFIHLLKIALRETEVTLIQHTSKIAFLWPTQSHTLVSAAIRPGCQIETNCVNLERSSEHIRSKSPQYLPPTSWVWSIVVDPWTWFPYYLHIDFAEQRKPEALLIFKIKTKNEYIEQHRWMLCQSGSSPHRCPSGQRSGSLPPSKPTVTVGQLLPQSWPARGESVHGRQHGETGGGGGSQSRPSIQDLPEKGSDGEPVSPVATST